MKKSREKEPYSAGDFGNTSENSAKDIAQLGDDRRRPGKTVQIESDFAHVRRQVVPYLYIARALVGAQLFQQVR